MIHSLTDPVEKIQDYPVGSYYLLRREAGTEKLYITTPEFDDEKAKVYLLTNVAKDIHKFWHRYIILKRKENVIDKDKSVFEEAVDTVWNFGLVQFWPCHPELKFCYYRTP